MHMPRTVTRSLLTAAVLTGLGGAFLAGTAIDRGGAGGGQVWWDQRPDPSPAAYGDARPAPAPSCEELLASYVERGLARVGPYGWGYGGIYTWGEDVPSVAEDSAAGSASGSASGEAAAPAAPAPVRSTSEDTGTNVQETGVDEPDVVKTDGTTLFRVEGDDLVTYDVSGPAVVRLGSLDLTEVAGVTDSRELLLAGSTVVVLTQTGTGTDEAETSAVTVDVADPARPEVTHTVTYDAGLVVARLHGDVVRLVLRAGLPDLRFAQPDATTTEQEAVSTNRRLVQASDIEDWLPSVRLDDGATEPLLDCEDVAVPADGSPLGTLAVVGSAASTPDEPSVTGLASDTDVAYASADQLYLVTRPEVTAVASGGLADLLPSWVPRPRGTTEELPQLGTTRLYAYDLDGTGTTYAAAGAVDGVVRDRWSVDAADGVLRLAVGPHGSSTGGNTVVTFRREGDELVEAGRVDGLGVGEDITAVRWFDTLAIVVTFRQTDPLYAVDLTDADDPELLGELEIPGFSAYLHPLGERRLLGLGEGPVAGGSWGAQAGLFDVTDLTRPERLDVTSFGPGSVAMATQDPRQLTWLPDGRTALSVVVGGDRAWTTQVSVLTVGDGRLDNRTVEVDDSGDPSAVRLVPLPDGRVVLVTTGGAEFFPVGG